jgi:hypothetical protein
MREIKYFCTHSAQNPEALKLHANNMARDG